MLPRNIILLVKGLPTLIISRTKKGEIEVIQRSSGIHATYHSDGHNHFYDPNSTRTWRKEYYDIAYKDAISKEIPNPQTYAERQSELVYCRKSTPIKKIVNPIHFIGLGLLATAWKEKYRKFDQIELDPSWDGKGVDIYITGKLPNKTDNLLHIIEDGPPNVYIEFKED